MSAEVMISIQSVQYLDGQESDGPQLITQGSYDYAEDGVRFFYLESELTGLEGTKTVFQLFPQKVILTRTGSVNAQMIFELGEKHSFRYQTTAGALNMGLKTQRLEWTMDAHGGHLEIEYDLNFDAVFLSRNQFIINVKEKELKT